MVGRGAEPKWLHRIVVDAVHHDLLRTHGGLAGVRDEHALESALARPRQRWAGGRVRDLASLAASYRFALARNHPYQDGNKRNSFVAMAVLLGLSGFEIEASEEEVVTVMLELAGGRVSERALAQWLRSRIVPYTG